MYQQRNGKKKESLEKEFRRRKVKSNTGGVHRTKLMTGYREDALLVLDALMELGGKAPTKQIRELSRVEKTTSILYDNYYGWFEHEKKVSIACEKPVCMHWKNSKRLWPS